MPSNVRQLLENGTPIYPITERSLVIGLQDAPFEYYVVAWDGASTPVVANIPAGVVVTYNNVNYTGTLAAGSATAPYLYLVASTTQAGEYDRYIVTNNGNNTFSWTPVGSTAPLTPVIVDNLTTNDATKALSAKQGKVLKDELSQFEAKVVFIPPESYRGYINTSKQWKDVGINNRFYKIFPIPDGSKVLNIKASGNSTSYYFLSEYTPTEGQTTGVISGQDLLANVEKTELVPATAKYLYVLWLSGTDRTPAKLILDDVDLLGTLKDAFYDERERVDDELAGFAKVSVYNPKWIVAGLQISTTGWVYVASTTRVCMRQGQSVHLYPGDVLGFKNYTGKTYYLGWINASGTYKTGGAWLTADYTVTEEGDYVFCLRNEPEATVSQASDLGDLFFIKSLRERVFANAEAISENTEDIAELNTDFQLFRSSVVGGTVNGVNLPFEIGTVFITDTGWNFQPNAQRARIKNGSPLVCKAGDKLTLSNYTLYKMYIGWKVGTTYDYYNGWLTQDFECPVDGEYEVLIARVGTETDLANVEELSQYFSLKKKGELSELGKIGKTRAIRSVCHQGYSTTSSQYGNNLAEGYIKAAEKGFDYGECDIQFSSDGVPFCCHQSYVGGAWVNAFYDPVAEEYVYFADNTAEQIKEHAYIDADHTVSTFEEVLAACKSVGLGLYIDKIDNITTDAQWSAVFALVKCYAMIDRVVWLIQTTAQGQKVLSIYPNAELSNIQPVLSAAIAWANALKTSANKVSISVSYTSLAVSAIKDVYAQLYAGVEICVYTIDTETDYKAYLPFVKAITSNKISEPMFWGE